MLTRRERISAASFHRSEHQDDENCDICFLIGEYWNKNRAVKSCVEVIRRKRDEEYDLDLEVKFNDGGWR